MGMTVFQYSFIFEWVGQIWLSGYSLLILVLDEETCPYLLKEKKRRKSKNLEEGQEVPVGC